MEHHTDKYNGNHCNSKLSNDFTSMALVKREKHWSKVGEYHNIELVKEFANT